MKKILLLCLALSLGSAMAQDEDIDARWEDAQKRLNDAAREIAELSSQSVDIERLLSRADGRRRAVIGVNIDTEGKGIDEGVRIQGVSPGGPAADAGLKADDVLLSINHNKLVDENDESAVEKLLSYMGDVKAGDMVDVEYLRGKQIRNVQIKAESLGPRVFSFSSPNGARGFSFSSGDLDAVMPKVFDSTLSRWGDLSLVSVSEELGEYFGVSEGLLVVSAPQDDVLGLKDGDVIQRIDSRVPADPRHAIRILRSYRPGEKVNIEIVRQKKNQSLDLELPQRSASNMQRRYFFNPEE
ncbi:MAG: PDZ domain-containing protein [Pseudomonadota bacterium]